jgi:hypothetical protein
MHGARGGWRRVRGAIAVGGKCGYRMQSVKARAEVCELLAVGASRRPATVIGSVSPPCFGHPGPSSPLEATPHPPGEGEVSAIAFVHRTNSTSRLAYTSLLKVKG